MFISFDLMRGYLKPYSIDLSEEQLLMFDFFAQTLAAENKKYNLTAITASDEIVLKHFVDSLLFLNFVDCQNDIELADVGTGAGFPGLALLIARPDLKVTLMDSNAKKLGFIDIILKELKLCGKTAVFRAEDAAHSSQYREKFDLVTARAVADLRILSEICLPLVKPGGVFAPMKGCMSREESEAGEKAIKLLSGKLERLHEYDLPNNDRRSIVYAIKISQTSPKYPRSYSQILKNPL